MKQDRRLFQVVDSLAKTTTGTYYYIVVRSTLHTVFSSKILGNKILRYSNLENIRYCQILDRTMYVDLVVVS